MVSACIFPLPPLFVSDRVTSRFFPTSRPPFFFELPPRILFFPPFSFPSFRSFATPPTSLSLFLFAAKFTLPPPSLASTPLMHYSEKLFRTNHFSYWPTLMAIKASFSLSPLFEKECLRYLNIERLLILFILQVFIRRSTIHRWSCTETMHVSVHSGRSTNDMIPYSTSLQWDNPGRGEFPFCLASIDQWRRLTCRCAEGSLSRVFLIHNAIGQIRKFTRSKNRRIFREKYIQNGTNINLYFRF